LQQELILQDFRPQINSQIRYSVRNITTDIVKHDKGYYKDISAEIGGTLPYLIDRYIASTDSVDNTIPSLDNIKLRYEQFIKLSLDYRKYVPLNNKSIFMYRLFSGYALPFGNSTAIPLVRRFFAGGAADIRGWAPATLGPGPIQDNISQTNGGEIKLAAFAELRQEIAENFLASNWALAFFVDSGNIWNGSQNPNTETHFKWNSFIKWFLKKSEEVGIKFSDIVIADNKIIQEYILNEYFINSHLIAYGGDNAKFVALTNETKEKYQISDESYAFKVCRIEPENNIDLILEAFKDLNHKLILIGNWNFSIYGVSLRKKYSKYNNLLLLDPIYHQATLDELRSNCGIYVHGHSVGGTNPSLVEAMNLGLLCFVYDVNYNRETTENRALYFKNADELKSLVKDIEEKKININIYKNSLLSIAKRRYTWDQIIGQYKLLLN
jgi:glycosyltransferase involved in cell wall biosynthesis